MQVRPRSSSAILVRLLVTCAAAIVYFCTPVFVGEPIRVPGHFRTFAQAFGRGELSISSQREDFSKIIELIPTLDGKKLYLAYPPFPAFLMIPFVWLMGDTMTSQIMCRIISVLNVGLFDACLLRMRNLIGRKEFTVRERVFLDLLFAFGTVTWHNSHFAGDWHCAHAIALAATLLASHEFAGPRRPLLIGLWLAIVILTRPTAAITGLFFLIPWIRTPNGKALLTFAIPPALAIALLGLYNWKRFGDPFDFGYAQMYLSGAGERLMDKYGQFSPHFVRINAFWFFAAPPWKGFDRFPWLGFDPRGLSLFIATPAFLFLIPAIVKYKNKETMQDGLIAIVACLAPLLAYFNTGYMQFGHRFSMDYLAVLMVLVIWGMGTRLRRLAYGAIALSILIQIWGVVLHPMITLPPNIVPMP